MPMNMFNPEEKLAIVGEYLQGNISFLKLGRKYGISASAIEKWLAKYKTFGDNAFDQCVRGENYTADFKKTVVAAYLNQEGSCGDIAIKFKIHSESTVYKWVSQYNNHIELTDSRRKGASHMVRGNRRKTTQEERIAIVEYYLNHQNNYAETATHFQVSYQQVYQWVGKFKEKGIDGLIDGRGRTKPLEQMSEVERLRSENRLLHAENRRMELENLFLKKLEEIEGRRS